MRKIFFVIAAVLVLAYVYIAPKAFAEKADDPVDTDEVVMMHEEDIFDTSTGGVTLLEE